MSPIDVASIRAIDMHTHVHASVEASERSSPHLEAMSAYFRSEVVAATVPALAEYYRARQMACVAFTVDATSATGEGPSVSNEEIAALAAEHSDVVIPFASLDPHRGRAAARDARRLVEQHGVRGFKFHPSIQAFHPNDTAVYPLYEAIEGLAVPVVFHSGHTGAGAGEHGGGGIRLKYSNPMLVDDVAVDFPDLDIVLAHPSFPWQDEALSVCLHKPKVWIDLSGWSPKYFPASLVQYANTLLKQKMLFGSDYPAITPDRWMADFERLDVRPEVRPLIMKQNALRLLGLVADTTAAQVARSASSGADAAAAAREPGHSAGGG
ncbi:MAG TPA: amidohydrolase family protein [Acidimicrobiales bacterium]|nr:amidohydrolase family protein [Acidimicrobiales bacterium]